MVERRRPLHQHRFREENVENVRGKHDSLNYESGTATMANT
jgi:hypothetical protein